MTTATSTIAETITRTLERTRGLANALLEGTTAEQFARQPSAGGKTINANHGAFVYGHLSLYPKMILDILGQDSSAIAHPEKFAELFMHGIDCVDDSDGSVYPSKDEIVSYFNKAHDEVVRVIKTLDDDTLNTAFTGDDWYVDMAGAPAALCIFMLHDHYMFHLGQMSTWRRCMGLGSAM